MCPGQAHDIFTTLLLHSRLPILSPRLSTLFFFSFPLSLAVSFIPLNLIYPSIRSLLPAQSRYAVCTALHTTPACHFSLSLSFLVIAVLAVGDGLHIAGPNLSVSDAIVGELRVCEFGLFEFPLVVFVACFVYSLLCR